MEAPAAKRGTRCKASVEVVTKVWPDRDRMSWPASDLQHGSGIREAYSRAALRRVNVGKDSAYRGCAFRLRRVIAFTSIDVLAGCLFLQFISLSRPPGSSRLAIYGPLEPGT